MTSYFYGGGKAMITVSKTAGIYPNSNTCIA